ncbi:hypothetical protein PUND_a0814 [Pseudoalteromonas undina]|nr:hypothetical protein PUND_a0814 [Pseudoalteromonas undina]
MLNKIYSGIACRNSVALEYTELILLLFSEFILSLLLKTQPKLGFYLS